jgi:SM-20-related protein
MDSALIAKFDLLLAPHFLEESICQSILEQTSSAFFAPATVYGSSDSGGVDERVRRASRLSPSGNTVNLVKHRLMDYKHEVERHFQLSVQDVEEPQFLRYRVGDFFVAHQDGNTGLIRLNTESERKISIVIFLNRQTDEPVAGTYGGGSLKFSDYRAEPSYREYSVQGEAGLFVAFRAELTHEVIPVTHGERYSIVSWYR